MNDDDTDLYDFDAPLSQKEAWLQRLSGQNLESEINEEAANTPGFGETPGVGAREPVRGRPNWIPTGPRNVGGRVRALAMHPTNSLILYAGAASGGIFKSINGGDTWRPLWHNQPSLSIGAIAVSPSRPDTVYVATGEIRKLNGAGIFRSDDAGATWTQVATRTQLGGCRFFESLVIRPTNHEHLLAVGIQGIFRTLDGGARWTRYRANRYFSDVALARIGAHDFAFFAQGVEETGNALLIRIADPWRAGLAEADFINGVNQILIAPPPPVPAARPAPARAKMAIAPSDNRVIYVRIADVEEKHWALYRLRNAGTALVANIVQHLLQDHADWAHEKQGLYNLCIAVDPTNPDRIGTGMVELYIARDANTNNPPVGPAARAPVTWLRAAAWVISQAEPGHHSDHHQILFDSTRPDPTMWIAHDGGVARSTNWHNGAGYLARNFVAGVERQPRAIFAGVTANTIRWQKRSHGIQAAQIYDLTQHPRLATLYGCGFQDVGTFFTAGGGTWQYVSGGDGGFVAFDPKDPYRFLVSSQVAIYEARFPGSFTERFPPRSARGIENGFLSTDTQRFAGDTAYHPLRPSRALHTRVNRLYGTTDGIQWHPLPVGTGFELLVRAPAAAPPNTQPTLEVQPSAVADKLGLLPTFSRAPGWARIQSLRPGPYNLSHDDALDLMINGTATTITFRRNLGIRDLANATPGEVATFIRRQSGVAELNAQAQFWGTPNTIEIFSRHPGRDRIAVTIGGGAAAKLSRTAGIYRHEAGRPLSFTLAGRFNDLSAAGVQLTFRININGNPGTLRRIPLTGFTDRRNVRPGELAAAINTGLGPDRQHLRAVATTVRKWIRLSTGGANLTIAGTALPRLGLTAGTQQTFETGKPPFKDGTTVSDFSFANHFNLFDPAATLQLTLNDGAQPAVNVTFRGADLVDRRKATVEEVWLRIREVLAAVPAATRPDIQCQLQVARPHGEKDKFAQGEPTALRFSPSQPDTLWAGGADGRLFLSEDDGATWQERTGPDFLKQSRPIEALALDPKDPKIAYVGLVGWSPTNDPGFLFKTTNGGETWSHIGAGIKNARGSLVGINAIEVDPEKPQHLYVATKAGIFRSTDGGAIWSHFNRGLPNVIIVDLAMVPGRRMLRAGTWGRGAWERRLTNQGHKDVQVYLRTSWLDDGSRPAAGGLDALATIPEEISFVESPDIKNLSTDPPGNNANTVVDGSEIDPLEHEEPIAGVDQLLFVQVHNRGPFPATAARVVVLWADASRGLPDLPPDFWARHKTGNRLAAVAAPWHLISDGVIQGVRAGDGLETVVPEMPRVLRLRFRWPVDIANAEQIVILAITSAQEDPLSTETRKIEELLRKERKIACRVTTTRRQATGDRLELVTFLPSDTIAAAPSITLGGNARTRIGWPVGGAGTRYVRSTNRGPFNLQGNNTLDIDDGQGVQTITFRQSPDDIPNLRSVPASLLRRYLARELHRLRPARRPWRIKPVIGAVDLSVSESTSDPGETPVTVTSGPLADLVVTTAAVAPGNQPALFDDAIARLRPDTIRVGRQHFFYVRARNLGTADQLQARCRLFSLNLGADPITHNRRAQVRRLDLERGESEIVEFSWTPRGFAAGSALVVFTVLDENVGEPLALAPNFADFNAFHDFCLGTNNVAYRRFEIV